MQGKRPGRPPKPLNPDASNAARLGAEIRARRQAHELTLNALGELTGFSFQHLSQVELAIAPVSVSFVAACDRALGAEGSLLELLPGVVCERAMWRHERSIARHADLSSALGCAAQLSEVGEDVDPTNLADAEGLMEHAASPFVPPWVGRATIHSHVRPDEARCWLWMQPSKAIPLYEIVLREWPSDQRAMGGLHQARLALACAAAGAHDRATAEGRKALAIARTTKSGRAARELKRLGQMLSAANDSG